MCNRSLAGGTALGITKEWQAGELARGYGYVGEKYVCAACFEDPAIKAFIDDLADASVCSYCHREGVDGAAIAAPIDEVISLVARGLRTVYGHPNEEGLAYESAEGGWQGTVMHTADVLSEEVWLADSYGELFDDLLKSLIDYEWCQKNYGWLTAEDALRHGWDDFCNTVKYQTRFFFHTIGEEKTGFRAPGEIRPGEMLDKLGDVVCEAKLLRPLRVGQLVYRARVHDRGQDVASAAQLGTAPIEADVPSNRMSAAGIPMFYGALDEQTPKTETVDVKNDIGRAVSVGTFKVASDLVVLDLSVLPRVPSIFDLSNTHVRPGIIFLHAFAHDVAKPIEKDGREHIEYVPTQIVTEFFRQEFMTPEGTRIAGILYRSSRNDGGTCCVLFASPEVIEDDNNEPPDASTWLLLSKHTVSTEDLT